MSYWRGKRAVVTGGSAGLGRAIAKTLIEHGARVMIVGRRQEALDVALGELKSAAVGDAVGLSADVTKPEDVNRLASRVQSAWGGLDMLCHCAGRSMRGTALGTSPEEYRDMWETNFLSAVLCTQAFAESLINGRGHLVLIGSLASKVAAGYLGAYPSSKFPLAALAQQLRIETEQRGLHTLLVCPGPIRRDAAEPSNSRYRESATTDVPAKAHRPGGGAKVRSIDPYWLSGKILTACERRRAELVVPWMPRLLFAATQISPRFGDWMLRRMTSG
jgi:NAD(P)-dependent dehydrogenase (short-subunit alcohol dehydrogenase family)